MSGNNPIPLISLSCPECKKVFEPHGKAHTLTAVCTGCHTYFGFGKWMKEEVKFQQRIEPAIPVYQKGKINGVVYEVLGFVVKRDKKYGSQWREYCLFNPFDGIAFLSEYNGHWNFLKPISKNPKNQPSDSSFRFEGNEYNLFQKYYAEIMYARGEFTFDIFAMADRNRNFEYISPPYMLGQEVSNTSQLWYKGEYISSRTVASAFGMDAGKFPSTSGVGATQPVMNVSFSETALIKVCAFLIGFIILIQLYIGNSSAEKEVFNNTYYRTDFKKDTVFVTPTFSLEGSKKSLTVKMKAPVDNDWFYADLSLINEATGDEYNFSNEVAYYHGYDDGNWSEGSTIGEAFLSSIPAGTYHLVIYPQFNVASSFEISLIRDVSAPSNAVWTILAIILFPVGYYLYKRNRDKKRWSESDYSPYHYDE